jgi:hypothetical protein
VTLPDGLKNIGNSSFLGTALTRILLPNTVTNIDPLAFYGVSLTSVTIPASVLNIGSSAFGQCTNLHQAYFLGNAPTVDGLNGSQDYSVFAGEGEVGSVRFLPGTTGWQANYGGWPTTQAPFASHPDIAAHTPGVRSNQFVFNVNWVPDASVVVEASTNLKTWTPIATNTLVAGTNTMVDSSWANYPQRFYRLR